MPKPRSSLHHVAISFIPGGYTPASATPVRNRKRERTRAQSSTGIAALKAPPRLRRAHQQAIRIRSARLKIALKSAPTTNPICTLIVSHDLMPSSPFDCELRNNGRGREPKPHGKQLGEGEESQVAPFG